jgi:non-heme chloroperoxidase
VPAKPRRVPRTADHGGRLGDHLVLRHRNRQGEQVRQPAGRPAVVAVSVRAALAVPADVPMWCADFEAAGPYFGTSPGASPGPVDWTIRMIVDTPLPVLLEALKVNADADMLAELQKIQLPTLIIHGDQDASAPIDLTGRKTAELIAGASLTVYPGAGHGLYASDHHTLDADLLAFINGASGRRI